jgi:hypothetical protein
MTSQTNKKGPSQPNRLVMTIQSEEFIQDKVINNINTYVRLSRQNKMRYEIISILTMVCAVLVTGLWNFGWEYKLAATLNAMVIVFIFVDRLFNFRENWRKYGEIASSLQREQLHFQTCSGVYLEKSVRKDEAFHLFVNRVEEILEKDK